MHFFSQQLFVQELGEAHVVEHSSMGRALAAARGSAEYLSVLGHILVGLTHLSDVFLHSGMSSIKSRMV